MSYVKITWEDGSTPVSAANMNHIENGISEVESSIGVAGYNLVTSAPTEWNVEFRAGTVSPNVTLPTPSLAKTEEIRYIFTAASATAVFNPPSGFILGDKDGYAGRSAGAGITYTNLTTGSIYEVSIAVIDSTHICLLKTEYKTA